LSLKNCGQAEKMNARERVFRTLKHEVPNRIPLDGWFLNSVLYRLIDHFGVTDIEGVLENLGIDFRTTCMEPKESIRDQFTYFSKLGLSIMIDDYFVRESGENEVEDEWGVKIKITGKDDTDWRYSYHPLNNEGELSLDNLQLPDLDSAGRFDRVKQDVSRWKGKYIVAAGVSTLFRKGWILSGYTRFLEALYLDRGFIEQLLDILMEFYTNQVAHYIAAGVDIIQFGGDLGTEESLMISPQMWRELFKPRLKQIIDSNRKKGIYFYLHSDGNIQSIIPDLIEIGFNILNPIQPECMDPRVIKERYGEKLTLHGTMSLQETFSLGKTEDVKVEVLDRLKYCGYNGGLILSPSNAFTDDIPMENILYFYKLVQETRM
jgi:uroporphyrinogen decarboxylase